jgi:hypothetical protein
MGNEKGLNNREKEKIKIKWKIKRGKTGRGGGQCCELAIFCRSGSKFFLL